MHEETGREPRPLLLLFLFALVVALCLAPVSAEEGAASEAEIREALLAANDLWVSAARSLDILSLEERFAGVALEALSELLRTSRRTGYFLVYDPPTIDVQLITLRDTGDSATAFVAETWAATIYKMDSPHCIGKLAPNLQHHHYQLELLDGAWKVTETIEDPANTPPERMPC